MAFYTVTMPRSLLIYSAPYLFSCSNKIYFSSKRNDELANTLMEETENQRLGVAGRMKPDTGTKGESVAEQRASRL
jgi:hypothetical protein